MLKPFDGGHLGFMIDTKKYIYFVKDHPRHISAIFCQMVQWFQRRIISKHFS
jgi:hypothetical protein